MSHHSWAAALIVVATLGTAQAQGLGADPLLPSTQRQHIQLGEGHYLALPGELRFVGAHLDGVDVLPADAARATQTPDDHFGVFRLRLRPAWVATLPGFFNVAKIAADAEVDLYGWGGDTPTGLALDPQWQYRANETGLRLTQAYGLLVGRWMATQFGLVRGHLGLGMVANAGVDPDFNDPGVQPFGFSREHDRSLRFMVSFFPYEAVRRGKNTRMPAALVLAGDAIIDDDTASWSAGDRAYQGLAGVRLQSKQVSFLGGAAYRSQAYVEGGETNVWLLAATGRWDALRGEHRLWLASELAAITGETTLSQSPVRPGAFDVAAVGAVGRVGYGRAWYDVVLETGIASGDANPFDDRVRTFSFDREYRVGLLMFNEATRLSNAVTAANVADPIYRGTPTRGYDTLASGGAVQNAIYLQPRMVLRPFDGFSLALGYLYGRSHEPVADAFRTGVNGGAPTAWRGATDATDLGHEIDLAVRYAWQTTGWRGAMLDLRASVQFAWFAPGDAFDTALGEAAADQFGLLYHLETRW
jgi:hypothetical protein